MATENIEGVVTDSDGNTVEGADVALFLTATDGTIVSTTTTASDGSYVFKDHPDADGTSQEWHVDVYYTDGSGEYNALSKPSVEASVGFAIPDRDILYSAYDASDLPESDGETVSALIDIEGSNNLDQSGGGTLDADAMNGEPAVNLANEYYQGDWSGTVSTPFAVFNVIIMDDTDNQVFSLGTTSNDDDSAGYSEYVNGEFNIYNGSSSIRGSSASSGTPYLVSGIFDGDNSELRVNKSQVNTGGIGTNSIESKFIVGARPDGTRTLNAKWSATYVYDGLPDVSKVEDYFDDKYGPF